MQVITDLNYIADIIKNNSLPVEIEIGCGNGHFITDYRDACSNILVGIDIKNKRCIKTVKKIKSMKLENIYIFRGRAENMLEALPSSAIEAFHIYFPDPWPKNRHRKRRFFRMPQLNMICNSLKKGGNIFFATDFFDYYLQAKVLIGVHNDLIINNSVVPPEELFISVFGKRFSESNRKIYFVCGKKIK